MITKVRGQERSEFGVSAMNLTSRWESAYGRKTKSGKLNSASAIENYAGVSFKSEVRITQNPTYQPGTDYLVLDCQHPDQVGTADPLLGTCGHDNNIPCLDVAKFLGPAYREFQLGTIVTSPFAEQRYYAPVHGQTPCHELGIGDCQDRAVRAILRD